MPVFHRRDDTCEGLVGKIGQPLGAVDALGDELRQPLRQNVREDRCQFLTRPFAPGLFEHVEKIYRRREIDGDVAAGLPIG